MFRIFCTKSTFEKGYNEVRAKASIYFLEKLRKIIMNFLEKLRKEVTAKI